jgi:4-amino-4-deoxy-L-arabinose transferase-like glycosyltransferase
VAETVGDSAVAAPAAAARWKAWALLLGGAAFVRGVVALGLLRAMPMVSDAHDYVAVALRLSTGDAEGAFYWPPGESLVLSAGFALFGPSIAVARALTVAIGTATTVLTALIARELVGPRSERTAGWMWAGYAPSVLLGGQAYAQHLAALCLATVAYCGMRAARERRLVDFIATGLALGVGILTRPSMASVVPVVAAVWALAARHERAARRAIATGGAAAICIGLACVLPICAHDARCGAGWTVSTNNERNLFLGNNPYTPDYKTSHLGQRSLDELEPHARRYLASFYARGDGRSAMQRAAIAYMMEHPARTAQRTLNRATSFWGFDYLASREIQNWRQWHTARALPLLGVEAASYLAVAALALIALFAMGEGARPVWRSWLVMLALAYEIPYAIAFSGGTYHFPVLPLLIPLAAVAARRPARTWAYLRRSRRAWFALCIFAIVESQYAYYATTMRG